MTSYYDPNTVQTLKNYDLALSSLRAGTFSDLDLDQAKLSVFSGVDAPVPPSQKGKGEFLRGITPAIRQENRTRLLNVTRHEVLEVVAKYLSETHPVSQAIVGPKSSAVFFTEWKQSEL